MRGDFNVDLSCLGRTIYPGQFFGCQASDLIPPQVSRKKSLRPFILTPSRPVGCLTRYCQAPSWEAQTSHFWRLWCDAVGDWTPASHTRSGRSNHYANATRGRSLLYIWRLLISSYCSEQLVFQHNINNNNMQFLYENNAFPGRS